MPCGSKVLAGHLAVSDVSCRAVGMEGEVGEPNREEGGGGLHWGKYIPFHNPVCGTHCFPSFKRKVLPHRLTAGVQGHVCCSPGGIKARRAR
jgi:hypothetical protein